MITVAPRKGERLGLRIARYSLVSIIGNTREPERFKPTVRFLVVLGQAA